MRTHMFENKFPKFFLDNKSISIICICLIRDVLTLLTDKFEEMYY